MFCLGAPFIYQIITTHLHATCQWIGACKQNQSGDDEQKVDGSLIHYSYIFSLSLNRLCRRRLHSSGVELKSTETLQGIASYFYLYYHYSNVKHFGNLLDRPIRNQKGRVTGTQCGLRDDAEKQLLVSYYQQAITVPHEKHYQFGGQLISRLVLHHSSANDLSVSLVHPHHI